MNQKEEGRKGKEGAREEVQEDRKKGGRGGGGGWYLRSYTVRTKLYGGENEKVSE